ncbi:PIN domain nuclease [Nocardia sp. NPDC058658]|uniref:PIN domain nuclease n=1 Tax=Nocardia sp. NPDC058658 TaxID=3346580 RepID=UPI00365BADD2
MDERGGVGAQRSVGAITDEPVAVGGALTVDTEWREGVEDRLAYLGPQASLCRDEANGAVRLPPVTPALYLIDTSGLFRIMQDKLRRAWADELTAGVIATCPIVELEFLYSARSAADRIEKKRLLRSVFGWVPMDDRAYERAAQVQELLTATGQHRSAGPVDLIVAATAERAGLTVLADDTDYLTVGRVTLQPVRMVTDLPRT